MKAPQLTLLAFLPALGFVAARPTPHLTVPSTFPFTYWDHLRSGHAPVARVPTVAPIVKSENDQFLDRWAKNFGTPAPAPVAAAPVSRPGIFASALTSAGDAVLGIFGKGKGPAPTEPSPSSPIRNADGAVNRSPEHATSRAAEKAPEKHMDIHDPAIAIVDWRTGAPDKYIASFERDEGKAGPSGTAFGEPSYEPDWDVASKYDFVIPEGIEVLGNSLTAEGLTDDFWSVAEVNNDPSHHEHWYVGTKERSGWQKFLDWCKNAWGKVKNLFTRNH